MEKEKGGITYWNVPVPKPLDEALEEAIKRDWHRTKTEFIREVVRHRRFPWEAAWMGHEEPDGC